MKKILFFLFSILLFISCSKDNNLINPDGYTQNDVYGTWTITKHRNTSLGTGEWENLTGITITFNNNGKVSSNYKYLDNLMYFSFNGDYLEGLGFWIDLQYEKDGMKWPSTFKFSDKRTAKFSYNSTEYELVK